MGNSNPFGHLIPEKKPNPFAALIPPKGTSTPEWVSDGGKFDIPVRDKNKDSGFTDFREGVAESGIRTYLGVKDLFGKASDAEKQSLADLSTDAAESGWGTGGNVVGELAQLAIPGGAAVKGAKMLSAANAASKVARVLPLAVDIAASAGHGAVRLPKAGESRSINALISGGGAASGAAIGKLAAPLVGKSMFRISPEAKMLLDEGVYLTPGMASESATIRGVESLMGVVPGLARGTGTARDKAMFSWADATLKKAVPAHLKNNITKPGHEGFAQVYKAIGDRYDAAWSKATSLAPKTIGRIKFMIGKAREDLPVENMAILNRLEKNITKMAKNGDLKGIDNALRKAQKAAKNDYFLQEPVTLMRETLRKGLPDEAKSAVAVMDDAYPKYLAVKNAVAAASEKGGEYTPKHLIRASRKIGGETKTALRQGPLQEVAQAGVKTVGYKQPSAPLDFMRRMSATAPTPAPLQTIGKTIMGQTEYQKALSKILRKQELTDYLFSPARFGAAYEE